MFNSDSLIIAPYSSIARVLRRCRDIIHESALAGVIDAIDVFFVWMLHGSTGRGEVACVLQLTGMRESLTSGLVSPDLLQFTLSSSSPSIIWNKRCLPLRTVDMRALGVANWPLILTVRGTGCPHPPLHSPGDCNVVGVVSFCFRICCFTWKKYFQ